MIELDRLLVGPGVIRALNLLAEMDLIDFLLPEVGLQRDLPSPGGAGTLFDVTVEAVGSAPEDTTARWAALLRFSGAPYLAGKQSGRVATADRARREQAALGAEIVEKTALYLKWSNRRREDVKRLVAEAEPEARADRD
jgi:tRNA nucleotidyltransferase/poly(A) polymerase